MYNILVLYVYTGTLLKQLKKQKHMYFRIFSLCFLFLLSFLTVQTLGVDAYDILKVDRNARQSRIDESFQKALANAQANDPQSIPKLRRAYLDLSDPSKRSQIDAEYRKNVAPRAFEENMSDLMVNLRSKYKLGPSGSVNADNLLQLGKDAYEVEEQRMKAIDATYVSGNAVSLEHPSDKYYAAKLMLLSELPSFIASNPSPQSVRDFIRYARGADLGQARVPALAKDTPYLSKVVDMVEKLSEYNANHAQETSSEYKDDFIEWFNRAKGESQPEALKKWLARYEARYKKTA